MGGGPCALCINMHQSEEPYSMVDVVRAALHPGASIPVSGITSASRLDLARSISVRVC